jgi:AraC-like DNA-binding protein
MVSDDIDTNSDGIPFLDIPEIKDPEEREVLWQSSIAPFFQSHALAEDLKSRIPNGQVTTPAKHRMYNFGDWLIADSTFPAYRFHRDESYHRRPEAVDHILVQLYFKGYNHVVNGDQEFREDPGGVWVVDCAHPINAFCASAEAVNLVLPRSLARETLPTLEGIQGALARAGSVAGAVFNDHMRSLLTHLPRAKARDSAFIATSTLALLDSLVLHGDPLASSSRTAVVQSIIRYVDAEAHRPDLSPDHVAARFRLSRGTLYRLFKDMGGLAAVIQRRRLVAVYRDLTNPASSHRGIFDIALDHGFVNASHFSRVFKDHFGMTARQARDMGRAAWNSPRFGVDAQVTESIDTMRKWVTSLGDRGRPEGAVPDDRSH